MLRAATLLATASDTPTPAVNDKKSVMHRFVGLERARTAVSRLTLLSTPPGSSVDDVTYRAYCYCWYRFCQDEPWLFRVTAVWQIL